IAPEGITTADDTDGDEAAVEETAITTDTSDADEADDTDGDEAAVEETTASAGAPSLGQTLAERITSSILN
ncbi:MAG: hypothetical protein ACJ70U_01380, partial [Nitrososphaera sp.]